jgi:hypothetical protein
MLPRQRREAWRKNGGWVADEKNLDESRNSEGRTGSSGHLAGRHVREIGVVALRGEATAIHVPQQPHFYFADDVVSTRHFGGAKGYHMTET